MRYLAAEIEAPYKYKRNKSTRTPFQILNKCKSILPNCFISTNLGLSLRWSTYVSANYQNLYL